MMKISGSASGSISQRHGSADLDPDPDSHQNVMDPQHCYKPATPASDPCKVQVQSTGTYLPYALSVLFTRWSVVLR
jgi:hypothetical protein